MNQMNENNQHRLSRDKDKELYLAEGLRRSKLRKAKRKEKRKYKKGLKSRLREDGCPYCGRGGCY